MVMPCSRSARSPSVSRAKSKAPASDSPGGFRDGAHVIFVDVLRIVQQPADQRGLAVIHAARGGEAQQIFASFRSEKILH